MYRLRELDEKDLPIINSWRNNKELIDCLGAPYRFINLVVDEAWFQNYLHHRDVTVRCSIVGNDDTILGLVSLTSLNMINQTATLHIMIGEANDYNKGIGTYAVKEMIQHAFNNLNLRRIELEVLSENTRARHVYEKVGFLHEGTKKKAVYKNGEFVDMEMYAIIKE